MLSIVNITWVSFNDTICAIICVLIVFLYVTLIMVAEAAETYWLIIYDTTYFIDRHLLDYCTV